MLSRRWVLMHIAATAGLFVAGTAWAGDALMRRRPEESREEWRERRNRLKRRIRESSRRIRQPKRRAYPPRKAYMEGRRFDASSPNLVRRIQQGLIDKGFDPGPVDGLFGSKTQAALIAFQRSVGLPPEGGLDHTTLESLLGKP